MDIGEFSKSFDQKKARDRNLAFRSHVLQKENCYNPLVMQRVNPRTPDENIPLEEIIKLNKAYFDYLKSIRVAIISEEIEPIIDSLSSLYERLFRQGQLGDFEDFLIFNGLFLNCFWHVCSSASDFPQDIICIKENIPSIPQYSFSFLKENETLEERLSDIFKDVVQINTKKIPTLRYKKNPFWQILTGHLEPEYDAFDHALQCLSDKEFQRQWEGIKKKSQTAQEKLLRKHNKRAKAHIESLDEFEYWKVDYTNFKIFVQFMDKRKVELVPDDFGKAGGREPKTWQRMLIILGGKDAEITPQDRQDVNGALKKIFDTSITFFPKNVPIPFKVILERSKADPDNLAE